MDFTTVGFKVTESNIKKWNNSCGISMFHRAFFNLKIDKHLHMHFFTLKTVLA